MDYLEKEYIDLKLKLRKYEAQMEIVEQGLDEFKKRLSETFDKTNDISQETMDQHDYDLGTLIDALSRDYKGDL